MLRGSILPVLGAAVVCALLVHHVLAEPKKPSCTCTDVDARVGKDKHLKFVRRRCWDSYLKGECDRSFMFNTVKELPEGFCRISCGRCDCCDTMNSLAEKLELEDWIWAMETAGLTKFLYGHGFEAAVLAPKQGALDDMLDKFGWSRGEVEGDDRKKLALAEILKFNMIPAIPNHWAVYSAPFLEAGMEVPTMFGEDDTVEIRKWGSGGTGFQGPHNSATVQTEDFDNPTCKGYINLSDQYLLPFEEPDHLLEKPSKSFVKKASCQVAEQTLYGGEEIDTIKTDSATECCDACNKSGECNTWVWCARSSGCHNGGRTDPIWWGTCMLKFSSGVAKGGDPTTISRDSTTPYHSGHISKAPKESFKETG